MRLTGHRVHEGHLTDSRARATAEGLSAMKVSELPADMGSCDRSGWWWTASRCCSYRSHRPIGVQSQRTASGWQVTLGCRKLLGLGVHAGRRWTHDACVPRPEQVGRPGARSDRAPPRRKIPRRVGDVPRGCRLPVRCPSRWTCTATGRPGSVAIDGPATGSSKRLGRVAPTTDGRKRARHRGGAAGHPGTGGVAVAQQPRGCPEVPD